MNLSRRYLVLLLLWTSFVGFVWLSTPQLPERVATHFGAGGEPDGWMTRSEHLRFMLLFGTLLPAFILGIFAVVHALGGRGLNIPHRDYWFAPERRAETLAIVQRYGLWMVGLLIVFMAGIHFSILRANAHLPALLPMADFAWIVGGFAVATLLWAAKLVRHFFRIPA